MSERKTILVTAYAVNPYKGSEDGMGWNFILQIARFNNVVAITRENNQAHIDRYMQENPDERYQRISFSYFDLPYWMRFWKKGGRGAMLYYWMWQRGVISFINYKGLKFDIAHNLNFHNDWTPSYLWKLGKPFVWGPIGHHPAIPKQYLKFYGIKYRFKDRMIWLIKKAFWSYSKSLKRTIDHADVVCCMNSSVSHVLNIQHKNNTIMPSVATEDFADPNSALQGFSLISAGRLVPLKGFDLSIRAFSVFLKLIPEDYQTNCKLTIVGSGPELQQYKRLCRAEGIEKHIEFIQWIDRMDLMKLYRSSSAFLFPSHEGAGMVVAEALSFGLPVICLKNCGPGEFINDSCGFAIAEQDYDSTVKELAQAIFKLYDQAKTMLDMKKNARKHYEKHFHWDRRGEQLKGIYEALGQ